jgi:hypothetical protein
MHGAQGLNLVMSIPCQPRDNTSAAEQVVSTLDTVPNFAPRMPDRRLSLYFHRNPSITQYRTPPSLPLPSPTDGGYLLEGAFLGRLAEDFCLQVIAVCVCDLFPRNCGGGARSRTSRTPSAVSVCDLFPRNCGGGARSRTSRTPSATTLLSSSPHAFEAVRRGCPRPRLSSSIRR